MAIQLQFITLNFSRRMWVLPENMNKILVPRHPEEPAYFGIFFSHRINSFIISLRNFYPKSLDKPNPGVCFVGTLMISLTVIYPIADDILR